VSKFRRPLLEIDHIFVSRHQTLEHNTVWQ
jgi:endonuclease/exonuclease/phosphatase family metal-dependent hydrolase